MKKPLKQSRLSYRAIGDETLILDTKLNKEVHQLNALGSFIWELCDGEHSIEDIAKRVCNEFDVDEREANDDILYFLNELTSKQLIEDSVK